MTSIELPIKINNLPKRIWLENIVDRLSSEGLIKSVEDFDIRLARSGDEKEEISALCYDLQLKKTSLSYDLEFYKKGNIYFKEHFGYDDLESNDSFLLNISGNISKYIITPNIRPIFIEAARKQNKEERIEHFARALIAKGEETDYMGDGSLVNTETWMNHFLDAIVKANK